MSLERKITAEPDGLERLKVRVRFLEKGKIVHEINHAFPASMSEEEVREEIDKAEALFLQEREAREAQDAVDEQSEHVQSLASALTNSKEKEEEK